MTGTGGGATLLRGIVRAARKGRLFIAAQV